MAAKTPRLTAEQVSGAFEYRNGRLFWKIRPSNSLQIGDEAGSAKGDGYQSVFYLGERVQVHRVVWMLHTGRWPVQFLDHINGVKDDNRIENLRECSAAQNKAASFGPRTDSKSRIRGVVWHKRDKVWEAMIRVGGALKYLGRYSDKTAAAKAYNDAASMYFGEFAWRNPT